MKGEGVGRPSRRWSWRNWAYLVIGVLAVIGAVSLGFVAYNSHRQQQKRNYAVVVPILDSYPADELETASNVVANFSAMTTGFNDYSNLIEQTTLATEALESWSNRLAAYKTVIDSAAREQYQSLVDSVSKADSLLSDMSQYWQALQTGSELDNQLEQYQGNYDQLDQANLANCRQLIQGIIQPFANLESKNQSVRDVVNSYVESMKLLEQYIQSVSDGTPNRDVLVKSLDEARKHADQTTLVTNELMQSLDDTYNAAGEIRKVLAG